MSMTLPKPGSDAQRIDALVNHVGELSGKITGIKETVEEVRDGFGELRAAVTAMARLEMRNEQIQLNNERLAAQCERLQLQIDVVKEEMPGLKELRQDIRKINWVIILAVLVGILALVVKR